MSEEIKIKTVTEEFKSNLGGKRPGAGRPIGPRKRS
jgi:hypothetical protein